MKAIIVMFDSLNRKYLPPYGCDWVKAPSFIRLLDHCAVFESAYAGSLPCMPARRELHTGRYNFLHRSWGPLEPFDDSMPELLKNAGIQTHLISDHAHYWEDGGATYHTRYSSWECVRGQEGDPWKCNLAVDAKPDTVLCHGNAAGNNKNKKQDAINRMYRNSPETSCQHEVFSLAEEFIRTNCSADDWLLQIEAFDPHEPFFTYDKYLDLYQRTDIGRELDWPPYDEVMESEEVVSHIREKYAAMVSMCDENLGRILDLMDQLQLWNDTMLIVNTDHGYLLGEHGWWAKNKMPCYDEIARIPLFIWDPRSGVRNCRRHSLVQTIDIAPTLLSYFGLDIPSAMQGKNLQATIADDAPVREYALFGYFGRQINITDGRYVYMRNAADRTIPLYEYTLMPTRMRMRMSKELERATLSSPFAFSKGMPLLKVPAEAEDGSTDDRIVSAYGSQLFDTASDPKESYAIDDKGTEERMCSAMTTLMIESEAPIELYSRMGLYDIAEKKMINGRLQ